MSAFGDRFDAWGQEQGAEPLPPDEVELLNEIGTKIGADLARNRGQIVRDICQGMAALLQQGYRFHKGRWWLFTLGRPARPLTDDEVEWHQTRGSIPAALAEDGAGE